MRVSKETAVLLKDAGYDVPCNLVPDSCMVDDSGNILYLPTLHEVADWLRNVYKIHVAVIPDGFGNKDSLIWHAIVWVIYERLNPQPYIVRNELEQIITFDTHEAAYEAGIVHGLKYKQ